MPRCDKLYTTTAESLGYSLNCALIKFLGGASEEAPPLVTEAKYARLPEIPQRAMPSGEIPRSPSVVGLVAVSERHYTQRSYCSVVGEISCTPPLSGIHAPIIKRGIPTETRCFEVRPARLPLTDEVDGVPKQWLEWRLFGVTVPSVNPTDKTRVRRERAS